jgi:hypothetical protein
VSVRPGTELLLADWRRQVSELYVEVRRLGAGDPDAALTVWRAERERLFRDHPMSPVPEAQRTNFSSKHFPPDPTLRFEVAVKPEPEPAPALAPATPLGAAAPLALVTPLSLPNSGADTLAFHRIGTVEIPFPEHGPRSLSVYWMEGYTGGLFLPFRDATSGHETYAAGRYLLDTAKSADLGGARDGSSLILDFNFAYQPSCAFDPQWACPLAPPENRLDIPIRAGERIA